MFIKKIFQEMFILHVVHRGLIHLNVFARHISSIHTYIHITASSRVKIKKVARRDEDEVKLEEGRRERYDMGIIKRGPIQDSNISNSSDVEMKKKNLKRERERNGESEKLPESVLG